MGIHISLGILVWGYTKHGDTHITVTPVYILKPVYISILVYVFTVSSIIFLKEVLIFNKIYYISK